jgi:molybdopterin/thiamine biosynthesis adenylyltransferase
MTYEELVSRNWGFLTPEIQSKIKRTKILLAGCGLGSNIALLAARTGFTKFILADGDTVETNNLNRQTFSLHQTGKNKAAVTAELIREVNPEAQIEVFPQFITEKNVEPLVTKVDFVINMVDPSRVIFELNRVAISQDKIAISPLNVGFGGVVLVFSPSSATLEEIVEDSTSLEGFFLKLVEKVSTFLPGYLERDFLGVKHEIEQKGKPFPQLGIASFANAALVVTVIIRALMGLPLKLAPQPITIDTWSVVGYEGGFQRAT